MESREHVELLARESARLVTLVASAPVHAPIPTCPEWDLADLVAHVGGLYRWSAALVSSGELAERWRGQMPIDYPPPDADAAELSRWLAEGASHAVELFAAARPTDPCWGWGADQHVRFWPRRMLFETCVHRVDAALGVGGDAMLASDLGVEGIDEHLENLPSTLRFGVGLDALRTRRGHLAIDCGGDSWHLALSERGFFWDRHARGDEEVCLSGAAGDCYLALLGRLPLDGPGLDVQGERDLISRFISQSSF